MNRTIVNIIKLIKERPRRRIRRRILLFFFCLIGALLIWLLNTLSRTYKFTVIVPITFENVPADKAVVMKDRKEIKLMLEGTGWHFLRSKISMFKDPIRIDLKNISGKNTISLDKQILKLNEQIPVKVKIININPTVLTFGFEKKAQKKIPVKLIANITFERNYYYDGKILLMPDSIVITGPSEAIDSINEWKTEFINFSDLNYTVTRDIELTDGHSMNIESAVKKILITIPVEKYTEGEQIVPIQVKGILSLNSIKMFPSVCTVRYQVSLNRYHDIKPKDFTIVASENSFNNEKLTLSLVDSPDYILSPQLSPNQIDYVIRK